MTTLSINQSCMNEHIRDPLFSMALLCNSVKFKYPIEDAALSITNNDDVALCFLYLQTMLSNYLALACVQDEFKPAFLKCMKDSTFSLVSEAKLTLGKATLGGTVEAGDGAAEVLKKMKQQGSLNAIFEKYAKACIQAKSPQPYEVSLLR